MVYGYFDGSCVKPYRGHGLCSLGVFAHDEQDFILFATYRFIGMGTINAAEYMALIELLESLIRFGHASDRVMVYGDNLVVLGQMRGMYSVRDPSLYQLHHRAKKLLKEFSDLQLVWIERGSNVRADVCSHLGSVLASRFSSGKSSRISQV